MSPYKPTSAFRPPTLLIYTNHLFRIHTIWQVIPYFTCLQTSIDISQVHADASDFALGITKEEVYKQVLEQAEALFQDQRNWVKLTDEITA
jgi:hypothetical protein